jgi:hypothetical protein
MTLPLRNVSLNPREELFSGMRRCRTGYTGTIASSRFPEKVYRHLIRDHVLPAAVVE